MFFVISFSGANVLADAWWSSADEIVVLIRRNLNSVR